MSTPPQTPTRDLPPALDRHAQDPRWPGLVRDFNFDPAGYAHASWWPAPLQAYAGSAALACDPVLREACSQVLLQDRGLVCCFDWNLHDPALRLFLIDATALQGLSRALGAACHRRSLRPIVRRQTLASLRDALGEAMDALWLPCADEVPHAPAPLPQRLVLDDVTAHATLRRLVEDDGARVLAALLKSRGPAGRAGAARAALKLPREIVAATLPGIPAAVADGWVDDWATDLVPRWARAWTWLF